MSNAEAIETLRANYPDACFEQLREAVDAAIEALKAQDTGGELLVRCKDCKYYEQNDDDYEGEQGEDSWGVCRNTGAGMMRCGYCSDGERKDNE